MDRQQIKDFLKEFLGNNVVINDQPNWVGLSCPLQRWTHKGGHDHYPSAGVSIHNDEVSIFSCWSCHSKGPLSWLVKEYCKYSGESGDGLLQLAEEADLNEFNGVSLPDWDSLQPIAKLPEELNADLYLDLYDSPLIIPEAAKYLENRGISTEATIKMQLRYDPIGMTIQNGKMPDKSKWVPRILFPGFSPNRKFYGFSGRAIVKTELKVRDYHGFPKINILLGSHLLRPEDSKLILVEGLFDYARMVTLGYPAVAVMKSMLSDEQAEILKDLGKSVYIVFDDDKAGEDGRKKVIKQIGKYLPIFKVRYPELDKDDIRIQDGEKLDPARLNKEEIEYMINDARMI